MFQKIVFTTIARLRWLGPLLGCCLMASLGGVGHADQPSILLIMADDIGIEGLGCYGGASYQTPHLDKLAAEGIRFTRAYSQPLCTPTRVQIMTGKYNHRNWKSFGILDPREKTFGHFMKDAGYATGIFGKWQLQSYDPADLPGAAKRRGTGMHPKDAGFDEYALYHSLHTEDKGSRYANPTMLEGVAGDDGQKKTYPGRYGEDVWVEKIVDFFDRHRDEPTFVYYPMALPHWPFEPTPNSDAWDPDNVPEADTRFITDMIEYMDTAVGNLLTGLEGKGLRENTLVLFYGDNGTDTRVFSKMKDGRMIQGGKATPKQTGIHVPLIANWPGHLQPSQCDDLVDASDFVPTLLELADHQLPADQVIDGISFAPRLWGRGGKSRQMAFFWYDPRPGWDKERFSRHVFALNREYKLFRSGRLFRLTDLPLQEIEVNPLAMSDQDRGAKEQLTKFIDQSLAGSEQPALVNAYGQPEQDLLYLPQDRQETDRIDDQLLATGEVFAYGDPTIEEQRLWIFPPLEVQDNELRRCVLLIHGGSWGGSPRLFAPQAVYLQRMGITSVVIHFRSPTRGGQPNDEPAKEQSSVVTPHDTLRDARMAYRWIVQHGAEHHIDPQQVVVAGGSAGGHLALSLCTIGLPDDPVLDPPPQAFVLFNPVIDLVDGWSSGRDRCRSFGIDPQSFSPAHHVRPGLPPTLVLSGSDDKLIPPVLIEAFGQRMKSAGNRFQFIEYPAAGHGFFNYGREQNRYFQWTMWELENFLSDLGADEVGGCQ